jgi:membrane protease YdiL (CAAX protease family)
MRPTALFFGYLFLCLALAALLTPALMSTGWIDYPPHRVMSRLAQVLILAGIWPLLRWLDLANRSALGYAAPRAVLLRSVGAGWVLGVLILLGLALALLGLGVRVPDHDPDSLGSIAGLALKALAGGLLIGLLEESFFRGALYTAVRRRGGVASAVVWTAALYALVHVLKPGSLPVADGFGWAESAAMFAAVFTDVFQWRHLDTLLALFMVGVFLALVRERSGHVAWCIGLHAGWVFVIQVTRRLTDGDPDAALGFLAGDYDGMIGWLSMAWIGLLAAGYWRWSRPTLDPGPEMAANHRD